MVERLSLNKTGVRVTRKEEVGGRVEESEVDEFESIAIAFVSSTNPISPSKLLNHSIDCNAAATAIYSASHVDVATVG